jgi:hypothetical protein
MLRRLQNMEVSLRTWARLKFVGQARTGVGDKVQVKVCLLFCGESCVAHFVQVGGVYS